MNKFRKNYRLEIDGKYLKMIVIGENYLEWQTYGSGVMTKGKSKLFDIKELVFHVPLTHLNFTDKYRLLLDEFAIQFPEFLL